MSISLRYPQTMTINGTSIESIITGYTTLEVTGREPFDREITTAVIKTRDGEQYMRRRLTRRTLTVRFVLEADTPEQNMALYEWLNRLLNFEEAKIGFADEPDKYYIGTAAKAVMDYINASVSTGTITIICSDPFKYSLSEKTVEFVDGAAEIFYGGTKEAYPVLEAEMTSTNGFVSFTKDAHTLLFGDDTDPGDEEAPVEPDPDALIEYTFTEIPATSEWSQNTGYLTIGNNPTVIGGTLAISGDPVGLYGATFGSTSNRWHGPTITRAISKEGGKVDCSLTCHIGVEVTANKQCGRMQILLSSGERNVAALSFYKNGTGSKNGAYTIYVNGSVKKETSYSMAAGNNVSGSGGGTVSITKQGGTITFNVAGTITQISDSALESVGVTEFTITFTSMGSSSMLNRCRLYSVRFTSPDESGGEAVVVEHAFHSGDEFSADCGSAETTLNNSPNYTIGTVENPWESFSLKPGMNRVELEHSDWATTAPTARIRYREVWI